VLKVTADWCKMKVFIPLNQEFSTPVSIIIAARNEEVNITKCLNCLVSQQYPIHLYEIIIVDDESTDNTFLLVQNFIAESHSTNIKLLTVADFSVTKRGKKNALTIGIQYSAAKIILTTDADCFMNAKWLSTIISFYERHHSKMIIGPVSFSNARLPLEIFQDIELINLVGFTGAFCYRHKPIMSNGANLAYERNAFLEVGGFEGIDTIASGDDVLLMNKFLSRYPGKIDFIKSPNSIVQTRAQNTLGQFIQQRVRWASKGAGTMTSSSLMVSVLVSTISLAILSNLFLSIFYGKFMLVFLVLFILKFVVDRILIGAVSVFFNKQIQFKHIVVSQLFYALYVVIVIFLGFRKQYQWKGRTINER